MATLIKPDGEIIPDYKAQNGKWFTLKEIQDVVGGVITGIYYDDGRVMYVNDDGITLGLPMNQLATQLLPPAYAPFVFTVVLGNAIIVTPDEEESQR